MTGKAAPGWWKEWRRDLTGSQRKRKCLDLDAYLWNLCIQVEAATLGLSGPREGSFYVGTYLGQEKKKMFFSHSVLSHFHFKGQSPHGARERVGEGMASLPSCVFPSGYEFPG